MISSCGESDTPSALAQDLIKRFGGSGSHSPQPASSVAQKSQCTVCMKDVSGYDVFPHPLLGVIVCERDFDQLCSDAATRDVNGIKEVKWDDQLCSDVDTRDVNGIKEVKWDEADGGGAAAEMDEDEDEDDDEDEFCLWCSERGGEVFCCDECDRGFFCKLCIENNLGATELGRVLAADPWSCYLCDKQWLRPLHDQFNKPGVISEEQGHGGSGEEVERNQILTDQLMGLEEELDTERQQLEGSKLQALRAEVREELIAGGNGSGAFP